MSPVTLSDAEAAVAAIVLEEYLESRQRELQHFTRMSAILGTDEPRPMNEQTRTAIQHVLVTLRPLDFTDPTPLLRAIATRGDTGTTADLADHFGITQQQLEPWLTEFEELEYIRELLDGRGNLTWELTPAGEAQL